MQTSIGGVLGVGFGLGMVYVIPWAAQVIGDTQIGSGQIDWQRSAIALIVVLIGGMRYYLGPMAGAIFWLSALISTRAGA